MTAIEVYTFGECSSLKAVEGMNAIQSIGKYAFGECSLLEMIDVHQIADIDEFAFYECKARINRPTDGRAKMIRTFMKVASPRKFPSL